MARAKRYPPLAVYLNGRLVGRLRREPSGLIDFQYDQTWLDWGYALGVSLSLPLREDRYIGAPVIAVFDNLLPDNDTIRGRIAAKVRAEGVDPYSLLAALGRDCVGALQFLSEEADAPSVGKIEGVALTEAEIAHTLRNLAVAPLGIEDDGDFRISLAGVQEKTAFLRQGDQWLRPISSTPTTHIFKPRIGKTQLLDLTHSVENEFFCLSVLKTIGLRTAAVAMQTFEDQKVLVVERFDREYTLDGRLLRVPQEDFCQALSVPWVHKYENEGGPGIRASLDLLAASDEAALDRRAFFKTMVLYWLLGATDGHAKNFSLTLFAGGGFKLAPLYDVISIQPNLDAGEVHPKRVKMAMALGDRRHYVIERILPRHFYQTGERAGLSRATITGVLAELAQDLPRALAKTAEHLPADFPDQIRDSVTQGALRRLDEVQEALVAEGAGPETA